MAPQKESTPLVLPVCPHCVVDELREVFRIWGSTRGQVKDLRFAVRKRTALIKNILPRRNISIFVDLSDHYHAIPRGTLELLQRFHREVGEQAVSRDVHHNQPLRISIRHRVLLVIRSS